ncbi:hypothetical protein BMS3Abin09_00732 [bacterium BMS3Abin09]|nr:hypothetical protein BMS3Abin09_00732 [bacterium BMS3Abin09]GBE41845.1 hypothetical protein BMS3Bbin09_01753 [bacterium BMS3Bbin09]HDH33965.1 DUF4390 domain-containing protein [Nitrospirota bacterium]HDN95249.1 DUF4390 domain-containing protein [Nitrospirota bacterium]HDO66789.1 DUF4390 domain-containing protein [Nitrospirota bacterium]
MLIRKYSFILLFAVCSFLATRPANATAPRIIGPDMQIVDNNIIVSISIDNFKDLEKTIKMGIKKEIVFTAELLRVWNLWPDEFIVSKKFEKVIKYDNLRDQYLASSYDGITRVQKKFKDYDEMRDWIFSVNTFNLANTKGLEPSNYYIRIIVESKSLDQIPLLGLLSNFIPAVEMSLAKESDLFRAGDNK